MHPPDFLPQHRLSDWPECRVEVRCGCQRSTMIPVRMLIERHGDQVISPLVRRLRCEPCGGRPAQIWLVAGMHHGCHGGPSTLDWAVEIRVGP